MKIILNNVWQQTPIGSSVTYTATTADATPRCSLTLVDNASLLAVNELDELLVLDDQKIPNPTINYLQFPDLNLYNNAPWVTVAHSGITLSQVGGGGMLVTMNNAAVAIDQVNTQAVPNQPSNIIGKAANLNPGQTYVFSANVQGGSSPTNFGAFLEILWYDAANTYLGNVNFFGPAPVSTSLTRYSVSGAAPANTNYAIVWLGVNVTNATNSGTVTFTQVQFEPLWGPLASYPTPFCGPNQTNCQVSPGGSVGSYIRQYRKFGGLTIHAVDRNYRGNVRDWDITAIGYAWLLSGILTNNQYNTTFDSTVLQNILAAYSEFDVTSLVVQGAQFNSLQTNWNDTRSTQDSSAGQSGFFWTVDPYWRVVYQPPGYTTVPISLIADGSVVPDEVTTFSVYDFSGEMDYTQPGNTALVFGGSDNATTLATAITAAGSPYTALTVAALPAPIPNGTILSLAGRQGITLSSAGSQGDTTLHIFAFTATADYPVGSSITPPPNTAEVIDPVGSAANGYGNAGFIFMRKVSDPALQTIQDCINRGIAEVLQYSPPRKIYHGKTYGELICGQGVPLTSNTNGLKNTTLLIQQVTATWKGTNEQLKDVWEYAFDLGSVNRAAHSIMSSIFRRTNTNSTGPTISQTALVAIERIGIQDGPPSSYAQLNFAQAIIAYFRLGETAGTLAYDSTGNGGNGGIHGSMTLGVPGAIYLDPNLAMLFDGSSAYISTALTLTSYVTNAFTVCGWVKLSTQTFAQNPRIAADSHTSVDNKGFDMFINANGNDGNFYVGTGAANGQANWGVNFQADKWYFVAGRWDGSNIRTYVNSPALVAPVVRTTAFSGAGTLAAGTNTTTALGYNPVYAGDFFPGTLDEMAFFQASLSDATLLQVYNAALRGHS